MPAARVSLAVGGVSPLTSLDYPGRLAAVVFLQGCPWSCGYCHNPHLIPASGGHARWEDVRAFLERRRGLLDAVVFSGGEPTRQEALVDALAEVRDLGFATGLHTGGAFPERLRGVLPLLDWVGMDVKTTFDDYPSVVGRPSGGEKARASARLLVESGLPHEFRTTVHPRFHPPETLVRLAEELRGLGARHWRLQEFRPEGCADESFRGAGTALPEPALESRLRAMFDTFEVRRA